MKISSAARDVVVLTTALLLLHATNHQVSARGGRTNPRNINFFSRANRAGRTAASTQPKKYTIDRLPYRPSPLSSSRSSLGTRPVSVIIGGAGMSGVSAASTLASLDMDDYLVIEAGQRVGGRMYPATVGASPGASYTVERGANWCVGGPTNPLVQMCQEVGLDGFEDFFETKIYDAAGDYSQANTEFLDGSECSNMDMAFEDGFAYAELCVAPGAETVLGPADSAVCNDIFSFAQPINGDDYSLENLFLLTNGWDPTMQADPQMARACEFFYVDWEYATESDQTGVVGTFDGFSNPSQFFVADSRGFKAVAEAVAAGAFEHTVNGNSLNFDTDIRLQLGTKVLKVTWDPNGVNDVVVYLCRTTRVEQPRDHELYPCMAGEQNFFTVTGKTFVSTFSLGVLQKSVELERAGTTVQNSYNIAPRFDPPLSSISGLIDVIDRNSLGVYNKVFLQFEHVFWDTDVPYMLSAASSGMFQGNFAPIFQGLDFKAYSGSKIIYVTFTGERAVDMAQKTQDQVLDEILPVLSTMYANTIATLYSGRTSLARSDVLSYTFAKWNTDPLFYGSYSIGATSYLKEDYEKFAEGRGNLYFAGEATCAHHWGFVHGAMFSGNRTARMVLAERHGRDDIDVRSLCEFSPEELATSPSTCIGKIPLGDFVGGIPVVGDILNFLVCLVLKILDFLF